MAIRWPELFFKTKKTPESPLRLPLFPGASIPAEQVPVSAEAQGVKLPVPAPPLEELAASRKTVEVAMAEADSLRALTRSGGLRISKRVAPAPHGGAEPVLIKSEHSPIKPEPLEQPPLEAPVEVPETSPVSTESETFLLDAGAGMEPASSLLTVATSLRRKAKLTDVAKLVSPAPAADLAASVGLAGPGQEAKGAELESNPQATDLEVARQEGKTVARESKADVATDILPTAPPAEETKSQPNTAAMAKEPEKAAGDPAPLTKLAEKTEFLLLNGERIFGRVLSENAENLFLEHSTLGVLTLPRTQIAQRPVEIVLINGDRIVGDILAENGDTLYVRHASLGMLTIPRSQRSVRVVEALLKDGDRILGEVLAETESQTVIRSATLGTVSVPHHKVAMLNRKVEQRELKPLPAALQDRSGS